MNRDRRIAIIGAGPAGLSAAWYLQQRGYRNVVVLEREKRVGGKCYSVTAGGNCFDLGAFTITWGYRYTRELAKAVGMPLIRQPERKVFDISEGWIGSIRAGLLRKYCLSTLLTTSLRYLAVLYRHRRWLKVPGFAGVQQYPEFTQPFSQWARARKLDALVDMFRLPVKDMGYGSLDDIPTVYILKYLHFWNFVTLLLYTAGMRSWPKRVRFGFERLWVAVALPLNVQTGIQIKAIRRHTEGVRVEVADEVRPREYDAIIITCAPNQLAAVMDYTDQEKGLFGKIRTTRYCTTLGQVTGMPAQIFNATDDDPKEDYLPGHPWEMLRAWPDNNHAAFYSMLDDDNAGAEAINHIKTDLAKLFGASLDKVVEQREWAYFPHVSRDDMEAGYFDQLENLQGQSHCYYSGSLLAFETVENVVAYSRALVDQHFPAQH